MWKCAGQRVRVFCTLNSCQSQCAHTFTRQYTCNGTIKLNYPSSPKSIFWHWDFSYSDHSAYTQVYDGEKENVVIYLSRSLLLYMYVNFVRTYISLPSNAQWDRYIYYDTFSIYTSGSGELTTHTHTRKHRQTSSHSPLHALLKIIMIYSMQEIVRTKREQKNPLDFLHSISTFPHTKHFRHEVMHRWRWMPSIHHTELYDEWKKCVHNFPWTHFFHLNIKLCGCGLCTFA